ncbi:MAG: PEP-CTERM sorting domain-containing protein [Methylovulum sp.]|nr:PEP-CTERM sorting domain-containing protein [Methylovulum sp.]
MRSFFAICCLLLFWLSSVEAAVLVQYPFTTDSNPSVLGAGVQSSAYNGSSLSNSYVGDDGFGNVLQAYPSLGSTDYGSAVTNNSFFNITVTANGGNHLNLGSLQFEVGKGGSSDPRGYFVRSSVDGFAGDLFSTLLSSGTYQAPSLQTIDLSSLPTFQNLSSIDFRFYIFTPDASINSIDFRNLELSSSNIPEPSALWLMMTGSLFLVGRRVSLKRLK